MGKGKNHSRKVEFKPGWLQEQVAKSVEAIKRLEAAGFKIPTVRNRK